MHSYAVETSKNDIANVRYYDTFYTSIIAKDLFWSSISYRKK